MFHSVPSNESANSLVVTNLNRDTTSGRPRYVRSFRPWEKPPAVSICRGRKECRLIRRTFPKRCVKGGSRRVIQKEVLSTQFRYAFFYGPFSSQVHKETA